MFFSRLAFFSWLASIVAGAAFWVMAGQALVIGSDPGGSVMTYYAKVHASHDLQIRGDCASACTMYLASRGVCVAPDARLWFHAVTEEIGTRVMLDSYPQRVRSWALRSRALESSQLTMLSGADLIAMGIRECLGRAS